MIFLELLTDLLVVFLDFADVVKHWRFFLCFVGGIALTCLAAALLPANPFFYLLEGAMGVIGLFVGLCWDMGRD